VTTTDGPDDFERLAEHWSQYDVWLRRGGSAETGIYNQPDLFCGSPRGISARNQLEDGVNFLFSESIRLEGVLAGEEFGVGMVFLLKALSFVPEFDWTFHGIDSLDCAWRNSEVDPI